MYYLLYYYCLYLAVVYRYQIIYTEKKEIFLSFLNNNYSKFNMDTGIVLYTKKKRKKSAIKAIIIKITHNIHTFYGKTNEE